MTAAVTVFAGRRDGYQLPLALREADLLEKFVTDLYRSPDALDWRHPARHARLKLRSCPGLSGDHVEVDPAAAALSLVSHLAPAANDVLIPWRDQRLSLVAARRAAESGAVFFPYSYYAGAGIEKYGRDTKANFVYQVHPAGAFLRKIYLEHAERQPLGRQSLLREDEFRHKGWFQDTIEAAAHQADVVFCASSFTRRSLVETGVKCPILVVPYGVDSDRYAVRSSPPDNPRLTVSFVGQAGQRKGLVDLLVAAKRSGVDLELVIVSRGAIPTEFSACLEGVRHRHLRGLSDADTWEQVRRSDLFALPSVAEGFGLVLLEAMSCGVPIVATTSTGAPDIIREGVEGFIIPPGDPDALAALFARIATRRDELGAMGVAARRRAEELNWRAFRQSTVAAYRQALEVVETRRCKCHVAD